MGKVLTCPSCGNQGEEGLSLVGGDASFDIRGRWQGRPVRKCNGCDGGFTIGFLGRLKPLNADLWARMQESWHREFGNGSMAASTRAPSATPAPNLRSLSQDEQQAFQQALMAALDDVLEDAVQADGVGFTEWGDGTKAFFTQFSRLLLMEATLAHEAYRDCGATEEELPYVLILAGLRPALEKSGEATQKLGASPTNPMKVLVKLAGPIQFAVDRRVSSDIFDAVQKRIYPDLPS